MNADAVDKVNEILAGIEYEHGYVLNRAQAS